MEINFLRNRQTLLVRSIYGGIVLLILLCTGAVYANDPGSGGAKTGVHTAAPPVIKVYVKHDATGNNDGSSWEHAYTDLQTALAEPCGTSREIWVARGTYYPTSTTDRGIYFSVPSCVSLYGGFAGTESALNERNLNGAPTILSGNIGNPVDSTDNSFNVMVINNAASGARVDGFTFSGAYNGYTAGSLNVGSCPDITIANCRFQHSVAYVGGGLTANTSNIKVDHCYFFNNFGGAGGGGISAHGENILTVTNTIFFANKASDSGGAYFAQVSGVATFINCLMAGNYARFYNGAAVYAGGTASTTLINCTIVGNLNRPALGLATPGTLRNCIVWGNSAPFGYGGSTATNSLIQNGYPGTGNINEDPLFVGNGDYHLMVCSPAANAGDNSYLPVGTTTDLGGSPRLFNNATVDMGAYELQAYSYLPIRYNVSGGGSTCDGGTISPVVLSNTETGVNYQWKINNMNDGAPFPGNNAGLNYGTPGTMGTYTVLATDVASGCTRTMNGFADVAYGTTATPFAETWYEQKTFSDADNSYYGGVVYGNGLFVAATSNDTATVSGAIYTSPDGVNWTQRNPGNSNLGFMNIVFGNNIFVGTGWGKLIETSPDGINWTQRPVNLPGSPRLNAAVYGNGTWVVAGSSSALLTSTDNGETWTAIPATWEFDDFFGVAYGNGKFVVVGRNRVVLTSTDGITWTQVVSRAYGQGYSDLTFGEGIFVAAAYNRIMTSVDGLTWTSRTEVPSVFIDHVSYWNGIFYATTDFGPGGVLTSPDGICWANAPSGFNGFTGIAYHNGVYAALGNGILFSTVCHTPRNVGFSPLLSNCAEGRGVSLELANSEIHYNYQLLRDGNPVGAPLAGTGAPVSLGVFTTSGAYSVSASALTGACTNSAVASQALIAGEVPVVSAVSPVCVGAPVNLSATSSVGSIEWYKQASGGSPLGNTASGANFVVTPFTDTIIYARIKGTSFAAQTFSYTGDVQTFVVPDGVTSIQVLAKGASGGAGYYEGDPGKGGAVSATMSVTPGQTLNIYVGGQAGGDYTEVGGYNGGGSSYYYGGGGGATDIRIGGTDLSNRVLVAGGGGGAGYYTATGGDGGGLTGENGADDYYYPDDAKGGTGGSQFAGGAGGYGYDANGYDGDLGVGGNGADYSYYGGGGGGGYYGGGGGGEYDGYVGGGGGSSYAEATLCTNVVHTQGEHTGDGVLTIIYGEGCISPDRVPVSISVKPSVTAISVAAVPNSCNGAGTTCTTDDTFTGNVTVTYNAKPGGGTLSLSGAGLIGPVTPVSVASIGATSYTFNGVTLKATGAAISLTADFSDAGACDLTAANAGTAPSCSNSCSVSNIAIANASGCNNPGMTSSPADDYFTANVTVTFAYAPGTGNLTLKRGTTVLATKTAGDLNCVTSWTFPNVSMAADGAAVTLIAEFSGGCIYTSGNLMTAPGACSAVNVSARVLWQRSTSTGIKDVTVSLSGGQTGSTLTPVSGNYSFMNMTGSSWTLTPSKDLNKLNGVTAQDVTRIQQHLSGANLITDPWQLIAADVNSNNTITSLDANIIQTSLLGNPTAAAQMIKSWRFAPASHNMASPPWGFPESISFNSGAVPSNLDFYGIKVGDVVATFANPANSGAGNPLVLRAPDRVLAGGETVSVDLNADPLADLTALQLALRFDPTQLQLERVEALNGLPIDASNFGMADAAAGSLRFLWATHTGSVDLKHKSPLFRLHFKSLETGIRLSDALALDDKVLPGYVYNSKAFESEVQLRFESVTAVQPVGAGVLNLQNYPNPFKGHTDIRFELPQACEARLRITDATGRLVAEHSAAYNAGRHEQRFELPVSAGVLYCELTTPFGAVVRKMVVVE